jgi:hypothetical protein
MHTPTGNLPTTLHHNQASYANGAVSAPAGTPDPGYAEEIFWRVIVVKA